MNDDQDQNLDTTDDLQDQQLGTSSNDGGNSTTTDNDNDGDGANTPPDDHTDDDYQPRQTRRERRQERYDNFRNMRDDFNSNVDQGIFGGHNNYKPVDYNKADELDIQQLEADRQQYGAATAAQALQQQRFIDQQERFYDRLDTDSDYVASRYKVLDENSNDFNPDLLGRINRRFMQEAGYDSRTRAFRNPSVRYKQFVSEYMDDLETFASTRNADASRNIAQQRSRQGVRPTGSASHKTLGTLKPGDISKMSPEEFAKYEKQIDEQINAMLK